MDYWSVPHSLKRELLLPLLLRQIPAPFSVFGLRFALVPTLVCLLWTETNYWVGLSSLTAISLVLTPLFFKHIANHAGRIPGHLQRGGHAPIDGAGIVTAGDTEGVGGWVNLRSHQSEAQRIGANDR